MSMGRNAINPEFDSGGVFRAAITLGVVGCLLKSLSEGNEKPISRRHPYG